MNALQPDDMHRIITSMPKDLVKLVKDHGLFLAGGAIRSIIASEAISDWDFFGPSKDVLELHARRIADERKAARLIATENAFTVLAPPRVPAQFITRWLYDDAEALCHSFDFSIACAVIYFRDGQWLSVCDPLFYSDLAAKRLRYLSPVRNEDAGGSMMRAQKFMHRGYHISPESLGRVMARLTWKMRESGMTTDEAGQAKVITGLLREVDPLTVIDGLEMREEAPEEGIAA